MLSEIWYSITHPVETLCYLILLYWIIKSFLMVMSIRISFLGLLRPLLGGRRK